MDVSIAMTATATGQTPVGLAASYEDLSWAILNPISVAHGESDLEVNIAPVLLDADIKVIIIKASAYPNTVGTANLSYKIHADTSTAIPMNAFHAYFDNMDLACGAAGLVFDKLFFSNSHASEDVLVYVWVGYVALA